jgi:V/A-type H+-transporting ATPase subunit D
VTRTTNTVNRAARLELRARLDLARHAVDLLRNKEEALRREQARLEGHAHITAEQWTRRCGDASGWLLRARALGAGTELDRALDPTSTPAQTTIAWQSAMGVVYPGEVTCIPGTAPAPTSTAAIVPTTVAYRAALVAGGQHAAATAALRRLEAELATTRRRRRAIQERLQPRLEAQLHRLDVDLDERDRDAAVRTQLAIRSGRTTP